MPVDEKTPITIFMCGDVMTGRGVDQILPNPSDPKIYEPFMKSAKGYVEIAEKMNGPIPRPVNFPYIWGDALAELEAVAPDLRIINLETAVTKSEKHWKGKGINYRMNPANVPVLTEARINYCSLANNHTLDWGYEGLKETIATLGGANILCAGAGRNLKEAETPAILHVKGKGRVLVFSFGSTSSGIPLSWEATPANPGINLIRTSDEDVMHVEAKAAKIRRPGDIVVVSIHWGSNWGYHIPAGEREFAHKLVDRAGVDVIHGHSSHHVKGMEVYKGKAILYGCGDFMNDYEGISGYEGFRDDLGLMYFLTVDPSGGHLLGLRMTPTQIKCFQIHRASRTDTLWLKRVLDREGHALGTRIQLNDDNTFTVEWG